MISLFDSNVEFISGDEVYVNSVPDNRYPEELLEYLELPHGAYIVGGTAILSIEGKDIPTNNNMSLHDIDIIYPNFRTKADHVKKLEKKSSSKFLGFPTKTNKTYTKDKKCTYVWDTYGVNGIMNEYLEVDINGVTFELNFIRHTYGNLMHHINRFDITPTMVAYDSSGQMYYTKRALNAINEKSIDFVNYEWMKKEYDDLGEFGDRMFKKVLQRIEKYTERGYKPSTEMVKILLRDA